MILFTSLIIIIFIFEFYRFQKELITSNQYSYSELIKQFSKFDIQLELILQSFARSLLISSISVVMLSAIILSNEEETKIYDIVKPITKNNSFYHFHYLKNNDTIKTKLHKNNVNTQTNFKISNSSYIKHTFNLNKFEKAITFESLKQNDKILIVPK